MDEDNINIEEEEQQQTPEPVEPVVEESPKTISLEDAYDQEYNHDTPGHPAYTRPLDPTLQRYLPKEVLQGTEEPDVSEAVLVDLQI